MEDKLLALQAAWFVEKRGKLIVLGEDVVLNNAPINVKPQGGGGGLPTGN